MAPSGAPGSVGVPIVRGIVLIGGNANLLKYIYGPYPVDIPEGWGVRIGGMTAGGTGAGSPTCTIIGFG